MPVLIRLRAGATSSASTISRGRFSTTVEDTAALRDLCSEFREEASRTSSRCRSLSRSCNGSFAAVCDWSSNRYRGASSSRGSLSSIGTELTTLVSFEPHMPQYLWFSGLEWPHFSQRITYRHLGLRLFTD